MKLSEERISHISHLIWDALYDDDMVDYPDEEEALRGIKRTMANYLKVHDEIDDATRHKIDTLKRGVAEGSREWEILYHKYYEEEAQKRRF